MASLTERILDECTRRGTCMLSRKEFDESFTGADLTIQVRGAIDFAQQHNLAFAKSAGEQQFLFSRLPKASSAGHQQSANERRSDHRAGNRKSKSRRRFNNQSKRPNGRSF